MSESCRSRPFGTTPRRPQLAPRAGAVSLISAFGTKVLVEGDHAIADFRWPLVLTAAAVAIVGVVVPARQQQSAGCARTESLGYN
jgi:hypothetical protein